MTSPGRATADPVHTLRDLVRAGQFREALALYDGAGTLDAVPRAEADLLAATAATRIGALDRATELASRAHAQFAERLDADGQMRTVNLLGAIAFERGALDDAERLFGEAHELARQLNDTLTAARTSNNLASVAHLRGRPEIAIGLYRAALLAYQRLGDRRGAAETWHNLGLSFRQMGDLREAAGAALEAVRHAELTGMAALQALTVLGRAEIDIERRDFDLAHREVDRAAVLAEAAADPLCAAEVRRVRALAALRQGDFERARSEAQEAFAVACLHDSALLAAECAAVRALASLGLGDGPEAKHMREEALAGFERLHARPLIQRFEDAWRAPR